jgi:electron transfer flavoprotein alpha subunit
MASLVLAEHDNKNLSDATAKTVTAAAAISTPVHVLVAGENCGAVADAAAKIAGVEKSWSLTMRCMRIWWPRRWRA